MVKVTMIRNAARLSIVDCEKRWKARQFCCHLSWSQKWRGWQLVAKEVIQSLNV